jgi:hypothetical protein
MTKKIITGFFALYVIVTGCKKDLDIRPTDTVDEIAAYNSVASLQKGLNTAYANYGGARLAMMFANSITSDETKFGPQNGGFGQFGYRLQYNGGATEVTDMFYGYYSLIDQVNRVLEKTAEVPAPDPASIAQRDYIKGQLLALRAMGHFELLQAYSKKYDPADPLGIPVMIKSCLTCQPARNTVAEVIAQVEKDLDDAKALMPAVTVATFNNLVMNQISLIAYQARVADYKGEWQKASDFATTVINSAVKPLVTGTAFTGIWNDITSNEILFRSRYETNTSVGAEWNNGGIIFSPSDKLTNSYSSTDIRKGAYIGTASGGRYVKKFSASSRGTNVVDVKGIRTAEMYLIRAEAKAELNDLAGAAADINALRAQRITGYTPIAYADKNIAITDIMLERFKELPFEGFRFIDLKRRGLSLQRDATDVDSPLWQSLATGDYRFVYPIPDDEILANKNIIQNSGY